MTSTLQILDDSGVVAFDLNSSTGVGNPLGAITGAFVEGSLSFLTEPELVQISPAASAGGKVISRRDPLAVMSFKEVFTETSTDEYIAAIGECARLLAKGGTLKWIPHGATLTTFIDFEGSRAPAIYNGRPMGLWHALQRNQDPFGLEIQLLCQPYPYGDELSPDVQLLLNGTLVHDFAGTANRPDNFAWDDVTGLSGETMYTADDVNWSYQATWANAAAHNLQQTTAVGTFAVGEVASGQFEARAVAVAGTPQVRAVLRFTDSGGTPLGSDSAGTLTTLTTTWTRYTVTSSAAPATTSRCRLSIQQDNTDATSVQVQYRKAQVAKESTPSLFRCGPETITYDPAGTLPRIAVFAQGTAPTPAKVRATADADGFALLRLSRESTNVVDLLEDTLFAQLESGTLGGNTTSTAVAGASASNAAQWTPTPVDPAFGTDNSAGGTGPTVTLTKPTSLAVGELLFVAVWGADRTSMYTAPEGWKLIGSREQTANTFTLTSILHAWYKIADAADVAATSFVFTRVFPVGGAGSFRGWIMRATNVDQNNPMIISAFATENNTTTPTAPSITTGGSDDDALIVTIFSGNGASGALTFTTPTGTTPTYTEQDDGTADVTFRGMSANTGVLTPVGSTGAKDSTAAIAIDAIMLNVAFRKSPAALASRSTVTFTGLTAGDYHVLLRRYPSAAARMRERVEYQIVASPTTWISFGDFINDVTGAVAFTWADRIMGTIHIPEEAALGTLTVRVSVGLEATPAGSPLWNGDFIRLIPANEHGGSMIAPSLLATSEVLYSDAAVDRVLYLSTTSELKANGQTEGPTPLELEPGLNLIDPLVLGLKAQGFADRTSVLGADPVLRVTHRPRFRT